MSFFCRAPGRHIVAVLQDIEIILGAGHAVVPSRTLIEIEGGIWVQGRHNRAAGFAADLEKYLEASLAGWRVIRLGPKELRADCIKHLMALAPGGNPD